jgi:plasmid stabilization system protein ParE
MAKPAVEFHPEAASDYYAALAWYRDRSINAARRFEAEFVRSMEQIQNAPERWPEYNSDCRRFLLHQFPFQIVYRPGRTILVVAVAHTHRRPEYWKERM